MVSTLFFEAEEKLAWSAEAFDNEQFGDSIYYTYASFISSAKATLLDKQIHVNTHHTLITDFDKHLIETKEINLETSFKALVLQINQNKPTKEFAEIYFSQAHAFLNQVKTYRQSHILELK